MLWTKAKVFTATLALTAIACVPAGLTVSSTRRDDPPSTPDQALRTGSAAPGTTESETRVQTDEHRARSVVVNAQGEPVGGALVYVSWPPSRQIMVGGPDFLPWKDVASAESPIIDWWFDCVSQAGRTREDGSFVLDRMPAQNTARVWVYHDSCLPKCVPASRHPDGRWEADLGRVMLEEGESVRGTAKDEQGRPVAGAHVGIQRAERVRGDLPGVIDLDFDAQGGPERPDAAELLLSLPRPIKLGYIRHTTTDDDGEYSLTGLEPGLYLIASWTEKHAPDEHEIEVPGPSGGLVQDFTLGPGESLPVFITYTHTRAPYPGARVALTSAKSRQHPSPIMASAVTDAAGRCAFHALRPGEYVVTVCPVPDKGGEPAWGSYFGAPPFAAQGKFKSGGECKLALDPVIPVEGVVVNAEDGKPVSSFTAWLEPSDWVWISFEESQAKEPEPEVVEDRVLPNRAPANRTKKMGEGRFVIENARPGKGSLQVRAPGFFPKEKLIEVSPEEPGEPFRLELVPGKAETSGLVLDDATSKPLGGVKVRCCQRTEDRGSWNWRETVTDAAGRFSIKDLLGGKFRAHILQCRKEGHVPYRADFPGDEPFPAELPTVRLVRLGALAGVVLNAAGEAVQGHGLWISEDAGGKAVKSGTTNADGRFLFGDVVPGTYALCDFKDETVRTLNDKVQVQAGKTTEVEIRLPSQGGSRERLPH